MDAPEEVALVFPKAGTRRFRIDTDRARFRRRIESQHRSLSLYRRALQLSRNLVCDDIRYAQLSICFQLNLRGAFKEKTRLTKSESYPTRRRAYIADTIALIVFFTTTGVINERFVAGMTWEQVLQARMVGAFLMVPVGRPYGLWRDWMMSHAAESGVSRLPWDSLALLSFQVPIYAAIISFSGATGDGLV